MEKFEDEERWVTEYEEVCGPMVLGDLSAPQANELLQHPWGRVTAEGHEEGLARKHRARRSSIDWMLRVFRVTMPGPGKYPLTLT